MPDWIEIILRTSMAVISLFVLTKLIGKRQISQLSLFEYITGISLGNIAGYVSLDLDNLWFLGLLSMVVWVSWSVGMEFLTIKSKKARNFIDGKGTVLIKDGHLIKKHLNKERITLDELLGQLRKKDVYRMADVEFAIMEANGEINVLLKKEYQPLTSDLLGWKVTAEKEAQTVIMDGILLEDILIRTDYDKNRIEHELKQNNLEIHDVLCAQIDSNGQLSIQTIDNDKQPEHKQSSSHERVTNLMEQFEAELTRLERLARNEGDRRIYQSALDRFQAGINNTQEHLPKQ